MERFAGEKQVGELLIYKVVFYSVTDHLSIVFQFQLFQYMGAVSTYRFNTQLEFSRDLGNGFSGTNHGHHLEFAVGQQLMQWFIGT